MKKILFISLAVLFALFAYLNLNDPDPALWVATYASVAVLFVVAEFGRLDRRVVWAIGALVFCWMLTMVPGMIDWFSAGMPSIVAEMQANEPHIEVVREFLGLLIVVLALFGLQHTLRKGAI